MHNSNWLGQFPGAFLGAFATFLATFLARNLLCGSSQTDRVVGLLYCALARGNSAQLVSGGSVWPGIGVAGLRIGTGIGTGIGSGGFAFSEFGELLFRSVLWFVGGSPSAANWVIRGSLLVCNIYSS